MTFFIADTHFGGYSILKFAVRPFASSGEMDEYIIQKWNSVVNNCDDVFVVGDFFDNVDREFVESILDRLNGKIILVMGNHDEGLAEFYREMGVVVYEYPVIFSDWYFVSHQPMYLNENMPYVNIFGHVHNNPIYKDHSTNSFCVCADRIDYTPVSFEQIKEIVSKDWQK